MTDELSKGFTGIEINGVRFSNIGEMLRYMDRQRDQLTKAKEIIRDFISVAIDYIDKEDKNYSIIVEAEQFISEVEK